VPDTCSCLCLQRQVAELQELLQHQQAANPSTFAGLKVKPPKPGTYSGGRDVANWLFSLERYFEAVGLNSDHDRLTYVGTLLDGAARSWWRYLYEQFAAGQTTNMPTTWLLFKEAICDRFRRTTEEEFARAKMRTLVQTKSVRAYNLAFNELALAAIKMDEQSKIDFYLGGLKQKVRSWVRLQHPSTLPAAMKLGEEFEDGELQDATLRNTRPAVQQPSNQPTPMDIGTAIMNFIKQQKLSQGSPRHRLHRISPTLHHQPE
jgi:hypothetical protein